MNALWGLACFELDTKRSAGLGFQDGKQGGGLPEGDHLFFLGVRQSTILIPNGQVVHPGSVSVAHLEIKNVSRQFVRDLSLFVAQDAGKDGDFIFTSVVSRRRSLAFLKIRHKKDRR